MKKQLDSHINTCKRNYEQNVHAYNETFNDNTVRGLVTMNYDREINSIPASQKCIF